MKVRKSGLELLRIIGIFLLMWVHDNTHKFGDSFGQFEYVLKDFLPILMVNIFIIISALYADKLKGRSKSVAKKIITYYLIAFIIKQFIYFTRDGLSGIDLLGIINMPWFARDYLIVLVLFEFINLKLNVKQSLLLSLIFFIMPFTIWWFNLLSSNNLNWILVIPSYNFAFIYALIVISAPILKVIKQWNIKKLLITLLSLIAIKITLDYVSIKYFGEVFNHREYNTLFNVLMPLFIVAVFNSLNFTNKLINRLSSMTFLIYLLESGSGLGSLIRNNMFTKLDTFNYVMSFTTRFIIMFTLAFIIQTTIEFTTNKIKNRP